MNQYVTGGVIKEFREKKGLTQSRLAQLLSVSDKTVSKWETGKGYPDITLLPDIAKNLSVSVTELLSGETVINKNISSNMNRSNFYVCPICGNIITATGDALITCHGLSLPPLEADTSDHRHFLFAEEVEDDLYLTASHEMTKEHYISFIATKTTDGLQIKKLYPEGNAEARFPKRGLCKVYFYCNKDGLFMQEIN